MIWEIFPHDKQWYFYGTKFLEVARNGVFVARNKAPFPNPSPRGEGSLSILNIKKLKSFKKPKTENVYKWNILPASPLGDRGGFLPQLYSHF